jgi:hypothetical protein
MNRLHTGVVRVIPRSPVARRAHRKGLAVQTRLLISLLFASIVACTPAVYKRDVTAEIQGPSQLRVGEEVYLTVRLHYSDGTVFPTEPSGYNSSANAMTVWVSSDPTRATVGRETGLVRGIAAGDVVITGTPSPITSEGKHVAGTIRITVTE